MGTKKGVRRTTLVPYPDEERYAPATLVSIPKDRVTPSYSVPSTHARPLKSIHSSPFLPATEESIALLDTAVMVTVRPRETELRRPDTLVNRVIEDITQQATVTPPAISLPAERGEQQAQRQAITATAGGAAIAGAGDLSYAALRYVTNVAMTHMVSPSVYGIFGEVYTAALILSWIARMGFDGVLVRLLSTYRVKGERGLAVGLARFSTWTTVILGLLLGIFFFISAAAIARVVYHNQTYILPLQEVALLIPLMALQLVYAGALQAFKEIKWKVYVDRVSQPLLTLIVLVILYFVGLRMEALSFSAIFGFLCSVLIGQVLFSKVLKRFAQNTLPRYTPKEWAFLAVPLSLNSLIRSVLNSTDVLFLSIFSTSVHAGIYMAADRVGVFVTMPLAALNTIFSPIIAEYYINGQYERLASMFKVVTKWSLSLSLPVFLCCLAFHDAILSVFGPQYTVGGLVLIIICLGNLVDAGTGSVLQILSMTGRPKLIFINGIITVSVNIGLSLFLVERLDILGAAIAAALAVIIINGLCLAQVYWIMKIQPYRWDVFKPLLAGGAAYLVGVLLLHVIHPHGHFAIFEGLSLIIPFMLVYILVIVLLRFSEEDRIVINAILTKIDKHRASNQH